MGGGLPTREGTLLESRETRQDVLRQHSLTLVEPFVRRIEPLVR